MDMEMEGVASIALLPSGSLSGHFIPRSFTTTPSRPCYGLYGTQIHCERECSRGEDHRLIKLSVVDYSVSTKQSKKEQEVVVECRGHDAARFENAQDVHGWEEDVVLMVESNTKAQKKLFISFECETLKAGKDAEIHLSHYLPHLTGCDAVVNIGTMKIQGLNFSSNVNNEESNIGAEIKDEDPGDHISDSQNTPDDPCCHPSKKRSSEFDSDFLRSIQNFKRAQTSSDSNENAEEQQAENANSCMEENKWESNLSGWRIKKTCHDSLES